MSPHHRKEEGEDPWHSGQIMTQLLKSSHFSLFSSNTIRESRKLIGKVKKWKVLQELPKEHKINNKEMSPYFSFCYYYVIFTVNDYSFSCIIKHKTVSYC